MCIAVNRASIPDLGRCLCYVWRLNTKYQRRFEAYWRQ